MYNSRTTSLTKIGVASECPYCLAAAHPWPPIGTSIVFLNGGEVGQSGVVVADERGICPSDRFLVKMPYDKPGVLRMVMPSHELFLDAQLLVVPSWMAPLSIRDNAFLHDSLPSSLNDLTPATDHGITDQSLDWIIATCWRHRLPLVGAEVWPVLKAHGADAKLEAGFINCFDFGTRLLTTTQGRPSVKRRRMSPMSKGRYITKAQQSIRLELFGHD